MQPLCLPTVQQDELLPADAFHILYNNATGQTVLVYTPVYTQPNDTPLHIDCDLACFWKLQLPLPSTFSIGDAYFTKEGFNIDDEQIVFTRPLQALQSLEHAIQQLAIYSLPVFPQQQHFERFVPKFFRKK